MPLPKRKQIVPKNIKDFSSTELQAELERRKIAVGDAPRLKSAGELEALVEDFANDVHNYYTQYIAKEGYEPKDGEHYLYEMLIKFLYGPKYFEWLNKVLD